MSLSLYNTTNIEKVECRRKIYFHYAETKHIYVRQNKYKNIILIVFMLSYIFNIKRHLPSSLRSEGNYL